MNLNRSYGVILTLRMVRRVCIIARVIIIIIIACRGFEAPRMPLVVAIPQWWGWSPHFENYEGEKIEKYSHEIEVKKIQFEKQN